MAMNVFGNPITISTLQSIAEFQQKKEKNEEITRLDKARVALTMKNASGNDVNVGQFVEIIGKGLTDKVVTYCRIYNATGSTLKFVSSDSQGNGSLASMPYPVRIANGQWAGFVHRSGDQHTLSQGLVVYRGENADGQGYDFVLAWINKFDEHGVAPCIQVSTKIGWSNEDHVNFWYLALMKRLTEIREGKRQLVDRCTDHGCILTVSTSDGNKSIVEAIFTLEGADV